MKITIGCLSVKLKYSYLRNGIFWYQRPIPKALHDRFDTKLIKINLKTRDPIQAAKLIDALNSRHEAQWAAPEASPASLKAHAEALLRAYDLKPAPAYNDPDAVSLFYDFLESKREAYAAGDEEVYRDNPADEYLKPSEIKAAQLLDHRRPHRETLSDALTLYLRTHQKRTDEKFCEDAKRGFGTLISIVGDKPFGDVVRADAHNYIDAELARDASTGSVRRRINIIHAVMNVYIKERGLNVQNPFDRVAIPGEGKDTKKRIPFTADELDRLLPLCIAKDDQARWIIAMLADTGARLAEVAGLPLKDIILSGPVPHIVIQEHPWRSLKTAGSAREVPLVGAALWAAKRAVEAAKAGEQFAFPSYCKLDGVKANGASATIVKWIRSQGMEHTGHELRHTMADRLRDVQCPEDIRFAIGGWATTAVGNKYGRGYGLEVKVAWMSRIEWKAKQAEDGAGL